jgi:TusA-related sulfurtransferase
MLPEILEKRFEEYKKDIPEFIELNNEFRKIQSMMIDANSEFRRILGYFNIKMLKEMSKGETFIVYTSDSKDNEGWLENNKDCGYLKAVPTYKGSMPLSIDSDKVLKKYWENIHLQK